MGEKVFEARDASFAYPGRPPSLCGVSFHVERGERVALLGANGSGKSTLLHLLDGLYFAQRGEVRAFGTVLAEGALEGPPFGPHFRKEVGFLFQNSDAQLFCPTVEEELAFGPLQAAWPEEDVLTRIGDVERLMSIAHLRGRAPSGLSSGEKKKVALASLLVLSPSVLLLDEPTAGLDPRSQSVFLELLEGLHDRGVTLVTATHDLELLPHVADRVIVLDEAHAIAADRPTDDVLEDANLLLAVNLIHAHPHRHGSLRHTHPHRHVVAHEHHGDHDHVHLHDQGPEKP